MAVSINQIVFGTHVRYCRLAMGRSHRRSGEIAADELARLYRDEQLSLSEVARRMGWSRSAIYSRLVALGIARRTPWARNEVGIDMAELTRLYLGQGLSMTVVAERCACSVATIWRKLTAAGVKA